MAGVSLIPSVSLSYSLPKLIGLICGLAILLIVGATARSTLHLERWGLVLLLAGAAVALGGVMTLDVPPDKIAGARVYETLYRLIPHINVQVQTSTIATRGGGAEATGGGGGCCWAQAASVRTAPSR